MLTIGAVNVLALVHDSDRDTGSVGERIAERGFELAVALADGELIDPGGSDLVVVFGSSASAYDDSVPWLARELDFLHETIVRGIPVLGICFGGQLLARALGGVVEKSPHPETGFVEIATDDPALVPSGPWMQFHFDRFLLPPGARPIARTERCLQAFSVGPHLGVQFHPEITPQMFDAWMKDWDAQGERPAFAELGISLDAIAAEVEARAEPAADLARSFFDAFVDRARAGSERGEHH